MIIAPKSLRYQRKVECSESGVFKVKIDDLAKTSSFKRDVQTLARIREILEKLKK